MGKSRNKRNRAHRSEPYSAAPGVPPDVANKMDDDDDDENHEDGGIEEDDAVVDGLFEIIPKMGSQSMNQLKSKHNVERKMFRKDEGQIRNEAKQYLKSNNHELTNNERKRYLQDVSKQIANMERELEQRHQAEIVQLRERQHREQLQQLPQEQQEEARLSAVMDFGDILDSLPKFEFFSYVDTRQSKERSAPSSQQPQPQPQQQQQQQQQQQKQKKQKKKKKQEQISKIKSKQKTKLPKPSQQSQPQQSQQQQQQQHQQAIDDLANRFVMGFQFKC